MRDKIILLVIRGVSVLPLPLLHAIGAAVGRLFYLIPNRERRNASINLALCFPELSEQELGLAFQLEYKFIFPRSRFRFIHHWEVLGFVDGGNAFPRDDVELGGLVYSFGLGARFDTGIGIISLVGAVYTTHDDEGW